MRILFTSVLVFLAAMVLAQAPQARLSYEDRSGTTGHTLVLEGKTFGPYKEITSVTHSTSATAGMFLVTKRDKIYVVAQGKESGPLTPDFDIDQSWVSDDGKLWALTAVRYVESEDEESDSTSETQLWVNGKLYGPFQGVSSFDYAEAGGNWLASVQTGEEEYAVLLNGKNQGTFTSVEHLWVFPDGKNWGFAATDENGDTTVVTQERTYEAVENYNFDQMYPRLAHWGMGFRVGDEEELILVDGKSYKGYLNYSGLWTTYSGKHWAFEAEKLTDSGDYPVVVVEGREFVGEGLGVMTLGDKEAFTWTVRDGTKVTLQVLTLP